MFDYNTLRQYARNGNSMGSWNGRKVFACSTLDLENKGNGAYYVLYDDENKIVGKDGKFYYSYGTVTKEGNVNEYNSRRRYNVSAANGKEQSVEVYTKYSSEPMPTAAVTVSYAETTGDAKLEIDVEATLKKAREMTIDDLLAGFNYGLE